MNNSSVRNRIISLCAIVILVIGWEWLSRSFNSRQILPGPLDTLNSLINVAGKPDFLSSLGFTLLRGLIGFLFAFTGAILIGIPAGLNSGIEAGFKPILITLRSTPVVAIILLALIWFKAEQVPVFIGFLTMFPILAINISQGIRETDTAFIQMAHLYHIKKRRILTDIYWPSILPYLYSGISTAIGFGWRSVIIGEVLSQPRYGIGAMMQDAQSYLLVSEVIAWTVIAILVSAVFEWIIRLVEKRSIRWKQWA
ncbi:MAG: ABC transporter permease [Porphyromonadaceae bacterium]|nr:MAG: ABC transporter permease [Porphyromonadaceae bacterium]